MNNPIYKPEGRAKEYGTLALNIYTGCNHGCTYCYARKMKERYTPKECISGFNDPKPRPNIVNSVKKQLATGNIKDRIIHLCFMCDPYPAGIDTTPTREIIKAIKNSGNHVQILTKGGYRAERDFDLLDSNDLFGVSLAGNIEQTQINEPGATGFMERVLSLHLAHKTGIKTWVSFEPVYDVKTVYTAIKEAKYIDLYAIGKLNYAPSTINWAEFGRECERLCQYYRRNYYIKSDLRSAMNSQQGGAEI